MPEQINLYDHVRLNDGLCPVVFETEDKIFETVVSGFLRVVDFWWGDIQKLFDKFEYHDIIFYGDLAGYVYNQFSEVSLGLVADIPERMVEYLDKINETLVSNEVRYKFINRPMHCRLLMSVPEGIPAYSLQEQKWINRPVHRELPFSGEELCRSFADYQRNIHEYVRSLPKHENNILTIESCRQLEQFLQNQKQKAKEAWLYSAEHEYSLEYLLWRTFKEVGGVKYFTSYVADSYNYNINVLEQF